MAGAGRADGHDAATVAQQRNGCPDGAHHALHVDVQLAVEGHRVGGGIADDARHEHAGRIDQDVEPVEDPVRGLHQGFDLRADPGGACRGIRTSWWTTTA